MTVDAVELNPGSGGDEVLTHNVGGKQVQLVKPTYGGVDAATPVTETTGLPTSNAGVVPGQALIQFMKDGSASPDMNVLATSGTPKTFFMGPAAGVRWALHRIFFQITDASFSQGGFGALSALSNGVRFFLLNGVTTPGSGGTITDALDGGYGITTHDQFFLGTYDTRIEEYGGSAGDELLTSRFTFDRAFGGPIILNGDLGEELRLVVQDDLTGLTAFRALVQGRILD